MKTPQRTKRVKAWALEDVVHFIIYRELDKLRVHFPYEKATRICTELRSAVQYRTFTVPKK